MYKLTLSIKDASIASLDTRAPVQLYFKSNHPMSCNHQPNHLAINPGSNKPCLFIAISYLAPIILYKLLFDALVYIACNIRFVACTYNHTYTLLYTKQS